MALHAIESDRSNEIAQLYIQWFLALEMKWRQELGETHVVSEDELDNELDFVMNDRHATISNDVLQTPLCAPSLGFLLCHLMHFLFRGLHYSLKNEAKLQVIDFFKENFRF